MGNEPQELPEPRPSKPDGRPNQNMNDTDLEQLAASLADLYHLGNSTLPAVAEEFSDAAGSLSDAIENAEGLGDRDYFQPFQSHGYADIPDDYYSADGAALQPETGESFLAWQRLCGEYAKVLSNTSENFWAAAGAVLLAVREYAEQDEIHAKLIDDSKGDPFISESKLDSLLDTDTGDNDRPEDIVPHD